MKRLTLLFFSFGLCNLSILKAQVVQSSNTPIGIFMDLQCESPPQDGVINILFDLDPDLNFSYPVLGSGTMTYAGQLLQPAFLHLFDNTGFSGSFIEYFAPFGASYCQGSDLEIGMEISPITGAFAEGFEFFTASSDYLSIDNYGNCGTPPQCWHADTVTFGFRIASGLDWHYGYAHALGDPNNITILDVFIQSELGTSITVGDIPLECPSDLSGDGMTDINDFIQFNSMFGQSCAGCPEDITGDGVVDVNDFLVLNSNFGQGCQ